MAHSEDRILEAMLRIQAKEGDWARHMFVFPTDMRIRAAALGATCRCRVIVDDEVIVMCRDDQGGSSTFRAKPQGIGTLGQRAAAAIERATYCSALAQRALFHAQAAREEYVTARVQRMRLAASV